MTRKSSNLKGGNGNTFPIEYYGGNSGRYTADVGTNLEANAYGNTVAQSYGEPFSDHSSGPNLHVSPGSSMQQTGGGNRKRRKRCGTKTTRRSSRCRRSTKSRRSSRSRGRRSSRGRKVNKKRTQRRRR